MYIYTTQRFLDGKDAYKGRRLYEVEDTTKAEYFIACGWAVSAHDVPEGYQLGKKPGFWRRLFNG